MLPCHPQYVHSWTHSVYSLQGTRFIWTGYVLSSCGFLPLTAECTPQVLVSLCLAILFVAVPAFITTHFWIVLMMQSLPVCQTILTFTRLSCMLRSKSSIITWNGKKKKKKKKVNLVCRRVLIDVEHCFERLMWGKEVILDILVAFQLSDNTQFCFLNLW